MDPNKYSKKPPVSPSEWGTYELVVDTAASAPYGPGLEQVSVPIVGSKHHGITPYQLTGEVAVLGEPDNPHDATALLVAASSTGEDGEPEIVPLGHVPRSEKHWFLAIHPGDWGGPDLAITYDGNWGFTLTVPRAFAAGLRAFNAGTDPEARRQLYADAALRNLWLSGWLQARESAILHHPAR